MKVMAVNAKKWLVTGYGSIDLDPAKVRGSLEGDDDYLKGNLISLVTKNLVGALPSNHTVLSIPTSRTFTRTFKLPVAAEKTLAEAVGLEVDQYIPLPKETLYIDYEVVERTKADFTVSMCAVPRDLVDRCIAIAESAGLRVCAVEPSVHAVARLLKQTEEGHLPTLIIDIGPATTDIAVLDGSIRVTGGVGIGGNTFTLDIAKKMQIPLENAHQLKVLHGLSPGSRQAKIKKSISPSLDKILTETKKVIRYYNERLNESKERKIEQVLVVGGGSNVPGIGDFFTDSLVMPARVASPWQQLNFGKLAQPAKQFRPRYITVAGLSLVQPERIWQ